MPVKTPRRASGPTPEAMPQAPSPMGPNDNAQPKHCCNHHGHHGFKFDHPGYHFCKKLFITFGLILMAYLIVWFGTLIRNNIKAYEFVGLADRAERHITLRAVGKAVVTPDLATISLGMVADGETVEEAQEKNTTVMNGLINGLKNLGIAEADIKTEGYNVYPMYDYREGALNEIIGYQASQNVTVKIRNLDNTEKIVALAGEMGANSVGALNFEIDDNEVYLNQAREDAFQKVYRKAMTLAEMLGVRLVSVVSYDEYETGGGIMYARQSYAMEDAAMGAPAPTIEPGTNEVSIEVMVTFEIR